MGVCLTCSGWGKRDSMSKAGKTEERIKRDKNNEKSLQSVPLFLMSRLHTVPNFNECFSC